MRPRGSTDPESVYLLLLSSKSVLRKRKGVTLMVPFMSWAYTIYFSKDCRVQVRGCGFVWDDNLDPVSSPI